MTQYTQQTILNTFGEMLDRMPFEKITVSALIRECGISRNTFYYHFEDIYGMLDAWLVKAFGDYTLPADPGEWRSRIKYFLATCRANKRRVYHLLDVLSRDRLERYTFELADNVFYSYLKTWTEGLGITENRLQACSEICCYSLLGMFLRFLWNNMYDDINEKLDNLGDVLEEMMQKLLTPQLQEA